MIIRPLRLPKYILQTILTTNIYVVVFEGDILEKL